MGWNYPWGKIGVSRSRVSTFGQSADEVEVFVSKISKSIERVLMRNAESVVLLGDFHDTCMVWDSDHTNSELKLKLFDLINNNDLHQMVHELTHIVGDMANILYLLITDSLGYIIDKNLFLPLGSFHYVVHLVLRIQYYEA